MGWKNWPYWVKGIIYGFLIALLIILLLIFLDFSESVDTIKTCLCDNGYYGNAKTFCSDERSGLACINIMFVSIIFSILFIISILIGAIIVFIYGKIKKK